jgi:hypothetical protein
MAWMTPLSASTSAFTTLVLFLPTLIAGNVKGVFKVRCCGAGSTVQRRCGCMTAVWCLGKQFVFLRNVVDCCAKDSWSWLAMAGDWSFAVERLSENIRYNNFLIYKGLQASFIIKKC